MSLSGIVFGAMPETLRAVFPCLLRHRKAPDSVCLFPCALIFPERKMLKLLLKDVLTSPGKLLAACLVVYLATISLFVGFFLALLAVRWLQKTLRDKVKALDLAEAESSKAAAAATEAP